METFERLQLAGLALICLKNETKADVQRDLRNLTPMPIELVGERGSNLRPLGPNSQVRQRIKFCHFGKIVLTAIIEATLPNRMRTANLR